MLELIRNTEKGSALYKCGCGNMTEKKRSNVKSGKTTSCGCIRLLFVGPVKHGHSSKGIRTKAYNTWMSMRGRCKDNGWREKYYKGKGISVCPEWDDFKVFLADMGEPESKAMTLDRIDNDKGYSKENCRWVPMKVQCNNKGNNRVVTIGGVKKTLSEWCEEIGVSGSVIRTRICRGMTAKKALNTSLKKPNLYKYQGQEMTLPKWADTLGISRQTLTNRLEKGIPIETAFSHKGYLNLNRRQRLSQYQP